MLRSIRARGGDSGTTISRLVRRFLRITFKVSFSPG
jgi:hypothetical protein